MSAQLGEYASCWIGSRYFHGKKYSLYYQFRLYEVPDESLFRIKYLKNGDQEVSYLLHANLLWSCTFFFFWTLPLIMFILATNI